MAFIYHLPLHLLHLQLPLPEFSDQSSPSPGPAMSALWPARQIQALTALALVQGSTLSWATTAASSPASARPSLPPQT